MRIAQHRPGHSRPTDELLRLDMVMPDLSGIGRIINAGKAGIGDVLHTRFCRRINRRLVLNNACADTGSGDEQHLISTRHGRLQRLRLIEIAIANLATLRDAICQLFRRARDQDQVLSTPLGDQRVRKGAAIVARGTRDDDPRHVTAFAS